MMNFFSAFSVKHQTQSFKSLIVEVSHKQLSFPRDWAQILPTALVIAGASRERVWGPNPKLDLHFHCKRSNFLVFVSSTLGCNTSGGLRARPAARGDAHISGPQFTQHGQGRDIRLPESGLSGDSTSPGSTWKSLMAEVGGAVLSTQQL